MNLNHDVYLLCKGDQQATFERAKWKALEHNKTAHRLKEYFGVEERRFRIYEMNVRVMVVKAFERPKNTNEPLPTIKKGSF